MGGCPSSPCPIYFWTVKHAGLIRRLFCVLAVAIVNSGEIPCMNKKRRFWPEKSDTAMKSGYAVKTWNFPKTRARSPLFEKNSVHKVRFRV
jgi:hypothetical protein